MSTRKITVNKPPNDPLERLIYERQLYIADVVMQKELNMMVVFLNTHKLLNLKISDYPRLKNATQKQLDKWRLIARGVGIHWKELDEDLSLKGFITSIKSKEERGKLLKLKNKSEMVVVE
jgi:hypothetical protein